MNPSLVMKGVEGIRKGKFGEVHSLLIYKEGRLVLEEYFSGHKYQWDAPKHHAEKILWTREMPHCIHSVTKSIVSTCIGIAIEQGLIEHVKQSIFDYLPNHQHLKRDGKEHITIEHLLTMTSGLAWAEWNAPYSSAENDQIGIYFSDKKPVDFILEKPLIAPPGQRFNYSGGDMQILAKILEDATGMDLNEFSAQYLFDPLNIESYDWWLRFRTGEIQAAGGLKLTSRDMVKIGLTFLDQGMWENQRILPEGWTEMSTHPYERSVDINLPGEDLKDVGYGYTWWTRQLSGPKSMYWANGWGGQKIVILPYANAVVVFTGAQYTSKVKQYKILKKYILPALN